MLVSELGADVGLAFDGDADRLIAVDELGRLVDGDRIMAVCALDMICLLYTSKAGGFAL